MEETLGTYTSAFYTGRCTGKQELTSLVLLITSPSPTVVFKSRYTMEVGGGEKKERRSLMLQQTDVCWILWQQRVLGEQKFDVAAD